MGRCLVIYDIVEDRVRGKVADICLDYGLSRIQYSAFVGNLSATHQRELLQKAQRRLGKTEGHVALFPICEVDFKTRREVSTP
jgi:CRISPR-associated protein Cas2